MVWEASMGCGATRTAALCKRSNRMARLLAYAFLEWILIALLLANGVFSYLISKFAAFFGLTPPCALCSCLAVDGLFEPRHRAAGAEPLRRVLCHAHAAEVSRLGYCRTHRRLADAGDMCEDCAAAASASCGEALLSWMGRSELGERDLACACCGIALESGFYSPSFLLPRPAARDLDYGCNDQAIAGLNGDVVFVSEEGPVIELFDEKPLVKEDSVGVMAARSAEIVCNVERLVPFESIDSLPVGVAAVSSQSSVQGKAAVDHGTEGEKIVEASDDEKVDDMVDRFVDGEIAALVVSTACTKDGSDSEIYAGETARSLADQHSPQEDNGLKVKDQEILSGDEISEDGQVEKGTLNLDLFLDPTILSEHDFAGDKSDRNTEEKTAQQAESKNEWNSMSMEATARVSETSDENTEDRQVQQAEMNQEVDSPPVYSREHADEKFEEEEIAEAELKQALDYVAIDSCEQGYVTSYENTEEKHVEQAELKQASTFMAAYVLEYVTNSSSANTNTSRDDIEVDPTEAPLGSLHQLSYGPSISLDKVSPDCYDVEEEGLTDTPTQVEGINYLQELDSKAIAMASDTKSVDSSAASMSTDLESIELVNVDQLKSALVAARKSLSNLYAELENERSAAAIAADETMAMINRLQEQKAAMQMEAMQYQRLMEEQSEYDQEALQRLNELIVKRDKERQDMERELELFRHKVHLYEAKEKRKLSRRKVDDQNGSSSTSSSAEDSDDLSQSFYEGDESGHGLNGSNGSIPTDIVLQETARNIVTLDGSLGDCEEERLSILEQLKVLEERLFDLEDEECDNMKMDKHFSDNHLSGASNDFSDEDISFKLQDTRKSVSYRGKKLLPLFDDANVENGNDLLGKQDTEADPSGQVVLELAKEQDKVAIANEIDQVHERLHALEADKEFIKQCVRSLNKGGKGFVLLQEILQHLRELRRIEQRARNSGELSPHYLHPYTD